MRRGLGGQLDVNTAYLCGFGEMEGQDSSDYGWRRKLVVRPIPPGEINILEIDDRFCQTDRQLAPLLIIESFHRGEREGVGWNGMGNKGEEPDGIYIG